MIRLLLTIAMILGLTLSYSSCKSLTDNHKTAIESKPLINEDDTTLNSSIQTSEIGPSHSKAKDFLEGLKNGSDLRSFFSPTWTLVYHEDNRCDGSTDGKIDKLSGSQIDTIIRLQVNNDGDGWACDKKEPKSFDYEFNLKVLLKDWDRFEIPKYENQQKNIIYVVGAGESDFLKLHYDGDQLIVKMEYRSEDPG